MSDNAINLDQRRRDKNAISVFPLALLPEEIAAKVAATAQTTVDREERGRLHMILVNATTQVLDPRPLSMENRLEIVRDLVRATMAPVDRYHVGDCCCADGAPIKAILDALRRSDNYTRIARRHGATKQAISLIAVKNGLRRYRRRRDSAALETNRKARQSGGG